MVLIESSESPQRLVFGDCSVCSIITEDSNSWTFLGFIVIFCLSRLGYIWYGLYLISILILPDIAYLNWLRVVTEIHLVLLV